MRIALVLLVMTGTAAAERPPTSAIAAVDNLLEDLEQKRYEAAVKVLAPEVGIAVEFAGACKKSFPKAKAARSVALAKCLVSDLKWTRKELRLMGEEKPTKTGWRVVFDDLVFGVRKRSAAKHDYEVFAIEGPKSMSAR